MLGGDAGGDTGVGVDEDNGVDVVVRWGPGVSADVVVAKEKTLLCLLAQKLASMLA